jgi:cysteine desulfurase
LIYADNAATTRISDSVFEKMLPFLREQYGNTSSQYSLGTKAKRAVELARKQVANSIGAEPYEIIFTSSGSEANSWILRSIDEIYGDVEKHIITSSIEHHSVLNACRVLEKNGVVVTYLPVDASGRVSVADVEAAIRPYTKLITIMFANNEIGTVQPIAEIGQLLKGRNILFHTDAVQAVGHIPVNVNDLQVDFLTASAHKYGGAKGTGILFKRTGVELLPLIFGGNQEHGLRAGTENVAGIVAAGYAIEEIIGEIDKTTTRLKVMVEATVCGIKEKIPSVRVNGNINNQLPGMVSLSFDGISGESLMYLLDLKGICVSTGSACSSGRDKPSHVLIALGQTEQQAKSAIRISYGRENLLEETKTVVKAICDAHDRIIASIGKYSKP